MQRFHAEPEQARDVGGRAVAKPNPDHLRWRAAKDAQPLKVLVFCYEDEVLCKRSRPDRDVVSAAETEGDNVTRIRKQIRQVAREPRRQVLVEQ